MRRTSLITEQEATLPAILPHIFHEEISGDRFRWIAMTFGKEVKKPAMQGRVAHFRTSFEQFVDRLRAADPVAEASMYWGTPVWDKFENPEVDRRSVRKRPTMAHP